MISVKTPQEITAMREGGKKLAAIRDMLLKESVPGTSLFTLEDHAQTMIRQAGGEPSFSTVEDYQWATCFCINEQVVHGIPRDYPLKEGDIFTIDIGMIYKGFHTDTAWTKIIGKQPVIKDQAYKEKERFLEVGKKGLESAIKAAKPDNRVGDISRAIQTVIEDAGLSVITSLTGHGVGKRLHEDPLIPGFIRGSIERTPLLTSGMTLAIEVIYTKGKSSIVYDADDGWTLATKDRSWTAVFEHSIAITDRGTIVLTEV